jgi:hypothetical protein
MYKYFPVLILILLGCKQSPLESTNDTKINTIQPGDSGNVTFNLLLDDSKLQKKNLFLVFSFQSCGLCKIFEKYHNDSIVRGILDRYLIIRKIDINLTPGGKELYATYGKIGFPSWTIIDSTKTVIKDSDDGRGNIGLPDSDREREYYLMAIKKAAPSLTQSESNILLRKLKEYRPDPVR